MRNFTLWGILVTLFAFIGNVNAEVITIDGANEIANNFFAKTLNGKNVLRRLILQNFSQYLLWLLDSQIRILIY